MSNTKWTRRGKLGEEGETVWLEGKMGGERLSPKWENNSPGKGRRKRKENREPFLGWWLRRRRRKRRQFEFSCPHGAATAAAHRKKIDISLFL